MTTTSDRLAPLPDYITLDPSRGDCGEPGAHWHCPRHRMCGTWVGSGDNAAAAHAEAVAHLNELHPGWRLDAAHVINETDPEERRPMSTWPTLAALVAWLDTTNGRGDHETAMRLMKLVEEAGEVMQAYIGVTGQNPRKGRTHSREDVAAELCDVALTALVALHSFTDDPEATFREHLAKVAARVGVTPEGGETDAS